MKFHKFAEEMPQVGKHILVSTEKKQVGMLEFDKSTKTIVTKCLEKASYDSFHVYVANADEEGYVGIENCPYWSYSTGIKLPA